MLEPKGETVIGEAVLAFMDEFIDEFFDWRELIEKKLIDKKLIDKDSWLLLERLRSCCLGSGGWGNR